MEAAVRRRRCQATPDGRGLAVFTRLQYGPAVPVTIQVVRDGPEISVRWPHQLVHDGAQVKDFSEALALAGWLAELWRSEPALDARELLEKTQPQRTIPLH
ncbi:MAG: hypothetical protein ABFS46_05145 [Myxococcota bacterium]